MRKPRLVKTNKCVTVICPHLDEDGRPQWSRLVFESAQGVCRRALKRGIRRAFGGKVHCRYLEEVINRYAIVGKVAVGVPTLSASPQESLH